MKKITVIIISFIFLSACTQSTVFLGPAISVGSSGNVMQAGYSYGTSMAVKQTTGKMASEHVSLYIEKEKEKKNLKKRNAKIRKEMINYLQSHIEIMREKLNLKSKL
tara:strand:- start:99 stop:419 length:321 start_codon:yes stop_codon:yes gene_type:complete